MRIAVVAPPWLPTPPLGYGGTELVLDTLCRGLAAAGHDVLLHATGDSSCPVELSWTHAEHLGTDHASPAAELAHAMAGYDAVATWGADVVHDHTITGPVWAEVHATRPVVTTNHAPFVSPITDVLRRIGHRVPIVAISAHQASTAGDIPVARVIRHGLDLTPIQPGDGAGRYALFLGRMSPDKGVHVAIEVAQRACVPLVIAAKMREPAELAYFRDAVEPRLGAEVEFAGEVGGHEKQALLRDAWCLLNPIAWPEPFGMVMIEALACGTPVVGTPFGATPEIVRHGVTGFLAARPAELARWLGRVDDLDRRACRASAEAAFSMERMAAEHLALYGEIVAGHPLAATVVDCEPGPGSVTEHLQRSPRAGAARALEALT